MDITDCKIIELPKIVDPRGNLSIIEQLKQIPFEIKRVYWFNFRYLPFIQAIHLPIWIAPNCKIKVKKNKMYDI